jgi:hypothetical protein
MFSDNDGAGWLVRRCLPTTHMLICFVVNMALVGVHMVDLRAAAGPR